MKGPPPLADLHERLVSLVGERDHLKRTLLGAAIVQEALRRAGLTVYVVGGAAVEAYSRGSYMTQDVDYALSDTVAAAMERLVTVEIDGLEVSLLSLEDIICDRVAAARQWGDASSAEWARLLMAAHRERINFDLLARLCGEAGCADEFQRIRAEAEGDRDPWTS